MAKWETKISENRITHEVSENRITLIKDGVLPVGHIDGDIRETPEGIKVFDIVSIDIKNWRFEREYAKDHHGEWLNDAFGRGLLNLLKKKGISHIASTSGPIFGMCARLIEKFFTISRVRTRHGSCLRVNWNVPSGKKGRRGMTKKVRVKETRAAKIEKGSKLAGRLAKQLPRTRLR